MLHPYKPYIPQTIGEIDDMIGWMTLAAPTFVDKTGFFSGRNIETTFSALKGAFILTRRKLGEARFETLNSLADQMRTLFEADPEDLTGDAAKGRELLRQMEDTLRLPRMKG